jgi:predicted ArsR family transcriptional regulator
MTLRYQETGEVHIDFHRSTNGTITHLRDTYGREFLDETFRRMAENVYRAIHDDLKAGDPEQLVEHWTHFFEREGGQFTLERKDGEIRFVVQRCPAVAYLQSRGIAIDPDFCRQTVVVNETLAEGTPFEITTEVLGGGKCVQTIRRRTNS